LDHFLGGAISSTGIVPRRRARPYLRLCPVQAFAEGLDYVGGRLPTHSALAKPFRAIDDAMGLKKQIFPKAMRRSFQDAMREAQVANVVVRSISGHLTEQMQQRYSTARGHEQESAIARIIDLTRVQKRVREASQTGTDSNRSRMDSKEDTTEGQHEVSG
jgi:hypothetical protein